MKAKGFIVFVAVLLLFMANLSLGSVPISVGDVSAILLGDPDADPISRYIIIGSRLPSAIVALLSGAALATCGLLLQTAFRNPLADPSIFGISSGAGLGAALVLLSLGGSLSLSGVSLTGFAAVLAGSFVGAMLITMVLLLFSSMVKSNVMLLIIGIMAGYIASSATSILNYFATSEGVKSYIVWGLGSFGGVPLKMLPAFSSVAVLGLLLAILMIKPLNMLLLGEAYAENLGLKTRKIRNLLLLLTGLLASVVTAFCGPVAFIGLAVPHVARLLLRTSDHRFLLPFTMCTGSAIALLCSLICSLPGRGGLLPLNAITPLIGAPVVVYIIIRSKK